MQPDKPTEQPEVIPPTTPITPDNQPPQPPAPGKTVKRRKFPIWAIIASSIVGVLVLVGLFAAVIYSSVMSSVEEPVEVSQEFVSQIQANDKPAAYALTSSNFRKLTPEPRFNRAIDANIERLQGEVTITNKSVRTFNGSTTAQILMELDSSPKTFLKVSTVKTEDGWQINGFDLDDIPYQAVEE